MLKKQPGFVLKKSKILTIFFRSVSRLPIRKRDCFSMKRVLFCGNVSVIPQSMQSL